MEFRCDSFPIPKYEERPDGYLSLFLPIAREGELKYINADGSERTEFVSAKTLQNSAHTFRNQPLTLKHPAGAVTPANVKQVSVGMTGRLMQLDKQGVLWVDGTVTDAAAITAIKSGQAKQLSCGYQVEVQQRADGVLEQVRRIGNHVALVDRARGGEDLTIRIDGVDAPHADCDCDLTVPDSLAPAPSAKSSKQRKDRKPMTQILIGKKLMRIDAEDPSTLDAIQAAVQEIVDQAEKATADATAAAARADAATATAEALTKERDGLQARIDAAEPATDEKAVTTDAADLKARIAVIRSVAPFMAKNLPGFNEDGLYDLTPQEIKTAYLAVKRPDLKERLDSASADYVEALYDAQEPAPATSESGSRVDDILTRLGGSTPAQATSMNADGMPAALAEARRKRAEKIRANGPMSALKK